MNHPAWVQIPAPLRPIYETLGHIFYSLCSSVSQLLNKESIWYHYSIYLIELFCGLNKFINSVT